MGNGPLPYRGGNWNNGGNAGVFALNLNNHRSNANNNIGFRSALPYSQKANTLRGGAQSIGIKGPITLPKRVNI
jgi:hypothetical protein